jgi:8-oxo-dGTP diphosphatase
MKKQLLLGTTNQAKIKHIQELFEFVPIQILSLKDLNIDVNVREDGKSPEENAEKKAKAYFAQSCIPTLAIDAGLHIGKFPDEKQPGIFVRRIYGADRDVTDEQVLDYYARELDQVGGESPGTWKVSVVLVTATGKVFSRSAPVEITLTSKRSNVLIPGAPISSLSVDPATGRYYSEMTFRERPGFEWVVEFMEQHLGEL